MLNPDFRDTSSAFSAAIDGVTFEKAWPARLEVTIDGLRVPVIALDDMIRNKRAVKRPQDLSDLARLEQKGS